MSLKYFVLHRAEFQMHRCLPGVLSGMRAPKNSKSPPPMITPLPRSTTQGPCPQNNWPGVGKERVLHQSKGTRMLRALPLMLAITTIMLLVFSAVFNQPMVRAIRIRLELWLDSSASETPLCTPCSVLRRRQELPGRVASITTTTSIRWRIWCPLC